jgi:threonine/homoserine/homoserine lactone efflux protein
MSRYGLISFCLIYTLAVATPGPGVAAVIARSLARGHTGAVAFIAGFVVGDLIWFAAAALGLSALAHSMPALFAILRYAGAAYLLWIAAKLWFIPVREPAAETVPGLERTALRTFLGSLTLTLSNPKPMLFFVALLPTVVPLASLDARGYCEIAAAIAAILPTVLGAYVLLAARARRWFRGSRAHRILNRASGTLMAAAAVAVATR